MFTRHDSVAPVPAELRTLAGARVVACRNYRDLPGVGYVVTVVAADDLGSGVLTDYPVDCLTIGRHTIEGTAPRAVVTDGDRTVVDDRDPAGLTAADYASACYDADNDYFDALDAADAEDAAEQPRPEHPLIVDLRRELDDTSIPPIARERITTVVDRLAKTLAGVDLAATLISSYLDDLSEALDLGEQS